MGLFAHHKRNSKAHHHSTQCGFRKPPPIAKGAFPEDSTGRQQFSGSLTSKQSFDESSISTTNRVVLDLYDWHVPDHDKQVEALQTAVGRICAAGGLSELVVVHGFKGAGKTTMIRRLKTEDLTFYCEGQLCEYETMNNALHQVISDLCSLIQVHSRRESIRASVKDQLKGELCVLLSMMPCIKVLFPDCVPEQCTSPSTNKAKEALSMYRNGNVLRNFLKAVAAVHPVTILFDDVQWADEATLDFVTNVVKDCNSRHILVIAAVREENISCIPEVWRSDSIRARLLGVGPLSRKSVNSVVAQAMNMKEDETIDLSDVVFKKTQGNVLFIVQYLEMLHRDELLLFNLKTRKWEWNADTIIRATSVSRNVADVLRHKISFLAQETRDVLIVSGCLGLSFSSRTLVDLVEAYHVFMGTDPAATVTTVALQLLLTAGFLEPQVREDGYKFSHNSLRQAAMALIPNNHLGDELRHTLGVFLLNRIDIYGSEQTDASSVLFSALDLLRSTGTRQESVGGKNVARHCKSAATKAIEQGAFYSGLLYADQGLKLLDGETKRMNDYELWRDLMLISAEMNNSCGRFEQSKDRCAELLTNCPEEDDRFQVQLVNLSNTGALGNMPLGIEEGLVTLKSLGVTLIDPLPRRMKAEVGLILERMRSITATELENLPRMREPRIVKAMKVLDLVIIFAWRRGASEMILLPILKMMELTLDYGMGEFGPFSICCFGCVAADVGDLNLAYECGQLAERLCDKEGCPKEGISGTIKVNHLILHHLKQPIFTSIEPALRAYSVAKDIGDVMMACYCLQMHAMTSVVVGMPLQKLERQILGYCNLCREFRQEAILMELLPYHQLSLNLLGKADNVIELTGSAMNESTFMDNIHNNIYEGSSSKIFFTYAKTMLLYLMDEYSLADVERKKIVPEKDFMSTYFAKYLNYFYCGMTCLALAQTTPKRKMYKKKADYYIGMITKLAKFGSVNCVHMLKLLLAEKAAAGGTAEKRSKAKALYDEAVVMSSRCGFRLITAIALERAALFSLAQCHESAAENYLQRAYSEFWEYGAAAKLALMKKKYGFMSFRESSDKASGFRSSIKMEPYHLKEWTCCVEMKSGTFETSREVVV